MGNDTSAPMTTPTIPDSAVDAFLTGWDLADDDTFYREVRASLAAAVPILLAAERERIASSIEAIPAPYLPGVAGPDGWLEGRAAAVRIVRADAP